MCRGGNAVGVVVKAVTVVVVMVAWLAFCGGREGGVVGRCAEGGWRGGEGGWWLALWLRWLVQNNDSKRKMATSKITARLHE